VVSLGARYVALVLALCRIMPAVGTGREGGLQQRRWVAGRAGQDSWSFCWSSHLSMLCCASQAGGHVAEQVALGRRFKGICCLLRGPSARLRHPQHLAQWHPMTSCGASVLQVCGFVRHTGRRTFLNPPDGASLHAADRLIVLAHSGKPSPGDLPVAV
jgi:hypothetical protein